MESKDDAMALGGFVDSDAETEPLYSDDDEPIDFDTEGGEGYTDVHALPFLHGVSASSGPSSSASSFLSGLDGKLPTPDLKTSSSGETPSTTPTTSSEGTQPSCLACLVNSTTDTTSGAQASPVFASTLIRWELEHLLTS